MELFKGRNLLEFAEQFRTDKICKEFLSECKWKEGYSCIKCSNTTFQVRADYSRTCNKCNHTESATENTLFHKVKFGVRKAFFIYFEMSSTPKSPSASYMGVRYGVTEKSARLFMNKVRDAIKSGENDPTV